MKPWKNTALTLSLFLLAGTASAQSVGGTPLNAREAARKPKVDAREAAELDRLRPLIEALVEGGALESVNEMLTTVRYSREIGPEAKRELQTRLEIRRVVLLGQRARAELARGEIEPARVTMQQAQSALQALDADGAQGLQPARVALSSAQAGLFRRLAARAAELMKHGDLVGAERTLGKAASILAATDFADPGQAKRSGMVLEDAEQKLAGLKQRRSLDRARAAERQGDLRLARLFYARAVEEGDEGEARQDLLRVEQMRREPWLDFSLSVVVPGLGQLNSGRVWPALGFFAGTGLTLTSGLLLAFAADDRYERYQAATDPGRAAELYDGINARWNAALVLLGVAASLYVWNVTDAYASSASWNKRIFPD